MKLFRLQRMLLLSRSQRTAREVRFASGVTLIKGSNSTGKSSVLKQIYTTFGAEPSVVAPRWREAHVTSAVDFSVAERDYTILREGNQYALFDRDDLSVETFDGVSGELANRLSALLEFSLLLKNRADQLVTPPPAYYLLPSYIDQDKGWSNPLESFAGLGQFSGWKKDLIEYHIGLRPNEYYRLRARLRQVQSQLEVPNARLALLGELSIRLEGLLEQPLALVEFDEFKIELGELVDRLSRLQVEEHAIRERILESSNRRLLLQQQLKIVRSAERELDRDIQYVSTPAVGDEVECPICGQAYENDFAVRFAFASDLERCSELTQDIRGQLHRVEGELAQARDGLEGLRTESETVRERLSVRKDQLTLKDLIRTEGRKEVRQVIQEERQKAWDDIGKLSEESEVLQKKMKVFDNPGRRREIVSEFGTAVRGSFRALNIQELGVADRSLLSGGFGTTGSERPRGVLGFTFGMLQMMREHGTAANAPVVIDSPNQQDQDSGNLKSLLVFIRDHCPKETQLVLAMVSDQDVNFLASTLELNQPYGVLLSSAYKTVRDEMDALSLAAFQLRNETRP
jgi:hypothetical protein